MNPWYLLVCSIGAAIGTVIVLESVWVLFGG